MVTAGVTFYSEPNYQGQRRHMEAEPGVVYSPRALGLERIGSVRVTPRPHPHGFERLDLLFHARLHRVPRHLHDDEDDSDPFWTVTEDTPDIGDWKIRTNFVSVHSWRRDTDDVFLSPFYARKPDCPTLVG